MGWKHIHAPAMPQASLLPLPAQVQISLPGRISPGPRGWALKACPITRLRRPSPWGPGPALLPVSRPPACLKSPAQPLTGILGSHSSADLPSRLGMTSSWGPPGLLLPKSLRAWLVGVTGSVCHGGQVWASVPLGRKVSICPKGRLAG